MSIPESPQTREEQYLNAIATGNASGIPETPQTREEMYLEAIAMSGGGGGSSLPEVTAADNGDVLTVVEGAWAKAAPSSGAFIVHATWGDTPETEDTITLDKTWNEINAAAQIGPVYIVDIYDAGAGTEVSAYVFSGTTINQSISGNTWFVNAFLVFDGVITGYTFETDSADGYPSYTADTQ